jgi:hypothetical protein
MAWEIVIFNLNKKVNKVEDIDDNVLLEFKDWDELTLIFSNFFSDIIWKESTGKIEREDFSISFFTGDPEERPRNIFMELYGEYAIYEIVQLCKLNGWQIFDMSLGEMLDIDYPEKNGYTNFRNYLAQIKHIS